MKQPLTIKNRIRLPRRTVVDLFKIDLRTIEGQIDQWARLANAKQAEWDIQRSQMNGRMTDIIEMWRDMVRREGLTHERISRLAESVRRLQKRKKRKGIAK